MALEKVLKKYFWIAIFNGEYWISYAEVETYEEAQQIVDNLQTDINIWETRISLVL